VLVPPRLPVVLDRWMQAATTRDAIRRRSV
jgi:hypothetical protein